MCRGKNALSEIHLLMSKTVAESALGPPVMLHLKDADFNYRIFDCDVNWKCIEWERFTPPGLDLSGMEKHCKITRQESNGNSEVVVEVPYVLVLFQV